MEFSARLRAGLLAGACTLAGICAAAPAYAQITPPTSDDCAHDPSLTGCAATASEGKIVPSEKSGEIIVTGTNIRQPNLSSPVPVTSISAATLLATGNLSLGDALNDLPALRGTFSQANSTRFIGTSGVNFLDLRGLGTSRTLVLVDGRRHVTSSPGDYLVDTNTIPDDLLERVDIITGGSSAVYGTDAIAGVVNFVLKQNFDGLKVSGQGGISSRGDRGSYYGSVVYGKNFSEGRGNIAGAVEYSRSNAIYNTDRDSMTGAYSGRNQLNRQEDLSKVANLSDGISDFGYYTGVRNGSISDGSTLTAVCNAASRNDLSRCRASGYAQRYMFQQDGSLIMSNPTLDFRDITAGGSSNTVGGLGSTLENTGQLDPKLTRLSVNLLAHYDVSDAFTPFVEAKYVRVRANQEGQPSFVQGLSIACDNPFVTSQALATLQSIGRCANPATGSIAISRFNVDFGGRGELEKRDTYRVVAGVRGNFMDTWHYEVAANYGEFHGSTKSLNNLLLYTQDGQNYAGFYNAIDAVRNASGQIVCGINADADPTNDDPSCVPISLFGAHNATLTPAALKYINTTSYNRQRASELDVTANLGGDFSHWFTTWGGGSLAFNIGAEYRRETAFSGWDALTKSGATFLNALQDFDPPALNSKEVFAEISLPIVKDKPFMKELSINGAGRFSHYNTAGSVWSYNGGAVYAPTQDIKIRFNYARSIRTPTQSDLYSTPSQNFGSISDPCDAQNRNTGAATRDANCTAAGIGEGFINQPSRDATLSYLQGGNPNLKPETSDSYTIGGIVTPRWLPGFSVSIDYYKITVNKLIATIDAQQIVDNCYDSSSLSNPYCSLVFRDPTTHLFQDPAVLAGPVNFARQKTAGIDVNMAYTHHFGNGDTLGVQANGALVLRRDNYLDVTDPNRVSRQLSNLGDPKWEAVGNFDYQHGAISLHYNLHFIGHMYLGDYANYYSLNGEDPQEPEYNLAKKYPVSWYHDVKVSYNVGKNYQFYVGVDNLTDRLPPYGGLGVGDGSSIYDNIGRFFYAGFKINM
ncbi:TonB-dependent receptor domain-containing protein [Sphingomonas abietis]|uniref:TonB-dependent receptor n=1 Tax=Sphingomonas abietis TaxID=3012344 RepID=A0ABY7NPK6_9SPHN|nr:TonB-dependent receptor [Sphingomonas abietis]WBO21411.1 TonB-dependent receptor [Sphingomonas abietis]